MRLLETVSFNSLEPKVPLDLIDSRADPQAMLAIHALSNANTRFHSTRTAIIALVDRGCVSHQEKVLVASREKKIRPGNFSRMGPHTIATYLATAKKLHGPTFALLGNHAATLSAACKIAESLLVSAPIDIVCLVLSQVGECTIQIYGRE